MTAPLQLAYYKGMKGTNGALQFNLQRPHYYCTEPGCREKVYDSMFPPEKCPREGCPGGKMKSREGALFLEITSTKGPNIYDWDNKIIFALSAEDMSKFLLVLEGSTDEVKLLHDPGAKSASQGKVIKTLQLSSPQGIKTGVICRVSQKNAGEEKTITHQVPLDASETKRLAVCLRAAIPIAYSWC